MGTAERRLEIMKYLCRYRYATMPKLAEMFSVSIKTVQRDIFELESTMRLPIQVKRGRYDGGIYILNEYTYDRMYMEKEETSLLLKIKDMVKDLLSSDEITLLDNIIHKYGKDF